MELAKVYQYISMNQEVPKIFQLVKKTRNTNISPILDIEDSLEIPFDPQKTLRLKSIARKKLHKLIDMLHQHKIEVPLNIRVNATESEHLQLDIDLLTTLSTKIKWSAIVLPKVSNIEILNMYKTLLSEVRYNELIVIAETNDFFVNASAILDQCEKMGISKIHFGHWDYFLSIQDFPIPLPDDSRLWKQVIVLIKLLDERGFQYIHTPYCHLFNHKQFQSMTNYLCTLTNQPVAVSSLTFSQGFQLSKNKEVVYSFKPKEFNYSEGQQKEIARQIVSSFEQKKETKFSFNISGGEYRFIAPHEYVAAVKYLQLHDN